MEKLADIGMFENLQNGAHARMGMSVMQPFNAAHVDNATFWERGNEVKIEDVPPSVVRDRLENINETEAAMSALNYARMIELTKLNASPSSDAKNRRIKEIEQDYQRQFIPLMDHYKKERDRPQKDYNIIAKSETGEWLDRN